MLLRRFMVHLRKQDWLAVGLDFVIVVAGVYLGLVLNEARETAALERGANHSLTLLLRDLTLDLERLDVVAEAQASRLNALESLSDTLGRGGYSEEEIRTQMRAAVFSNRTLVQRDTIYDVLESSGQLATLSPELQELITRTYAYDFPSIIEVGVRIDDAQDAILVNCIGRYWNWSTQRMRTLTQADVFELQSCLGFLAEFTRYYIDLSQAERRAHAEELQAALRRELGVTAQ